MTMFPDNGWVDPGWRPALRSVLNSRDKKKEKDVDGLTQTRILFLSLLISGLLILWVLYYIVSGFGEIDAGQALLIVVLGLLGIRGAGWARNRPLDVTTAARLAGSYRTGFFLGFAFAEAPLLIAVAISVINDELWPFVVVFPLYVVGMIVAAPSRANLARVQQRITSLGSSLSIVAALMQPAPPPDSDARQPPP
jgi:hypothetical protein